MSINKLVASVLVSLVLVSGVAQVASAATITVDPTTCKATGGTPIPGPDGKDSNRCKLSSN